MPGQHLLVIPVAPELKAELQAEAWVSRLTLAEYLRQLIARSKTPDGRVRSWAKMRKRGRPRRY